jgi:hypothetical protein
MRVSVKDSLREKPVELVSSLLMIGAGALLTATASTNASMAVIGNLLSVVGGALLSWASVSLTSKEAAAELLRPQLSAVARQLDSVSGQISKAVSDAKAGEASAEAALSLVSQATRIMYASVNEIHVVLDQEVESQELLDTAQKVEV